MCYFSKKFNFKFKVQVNYSGGRAGPYLGIGTGEKPVAVYADHNPLTFLSSLHSPNQRLMRWTLFLQSHNSEVRHIKGKDNIMADAFSRAPVNNNKAALN